jgi:copper chaperone CopZ
LIQRYRLSGLTNGDEAVAVTKAVETLQMVERALVDLDTAELVVEGEAEEQAIREMVAAAGYQVAGRM